MLFKSALKIIMTTGISRAFSEIYIHFIDVYTNVILIFFDVYGDFLGKLNECVE